MNTIGFKIPLGATTDLKMAYEQYNVPLAGDILDDLAMAFRELITKVCFTHLHQDLPCETSCVAVSLLFGNWNVCHTLKTRYTFVGRRIHLELSG